MDADHRTDFISKRKTKPKLSLEAHPHEPPTKEEGEGEEEEEEDDDDDDEGSESEGLLPPRRGGTTTDSEATTLPRKVRWNDRHGHELAEVLVFQPSDESDTDDEKSDFCSCTVM